MEEGALQSRAEQKEAVKGDKFRKESKGWWNMNNGQIEVGGSGEQ